jgi:Transposase IS116/IS110/IS902 family
LAWIGLVPKQHSSGGKDRLGSISKQGDRYLRSLFVAGALAVIRYAKVHGTKHRPWLTALLGRRPTKVAAIALANKIARMAWAMMAKGERYRNLGASIHCFGQLMRAIFLRSSLITTTASAQNFAPSRFDLRRGQARYGVVQKRRAHGAKAISEIHLLARAGAGSLCVAFVPIKLHGLASQRLSSRSIH